LPATPAASPSRELADLHALSRLFPWRGPTEAVAQRFARLRDDGGPPPAIGDYLCALAAGWPRIEVQRLAQSTGRQVVAVPRHIAEATAAQMRHEGGRDSPALHLASIKRQLDRDAPEYRQ